MADPFLAEIRLLPFNFAPVGWAFCHGQILPISQNTALFSLLGTTYGGDGRSNFALPDLRGRVPLHPDNQSIFLGEQGGSEAAPLTAAQLPAHNHLAVCNTAVGDDYGPAGNFWAKDFGGSNEYGATGTMQMAAGAVGVSGDSQPHNNLQPYLVLNYCIALQGIFPPQS